MIGVIVNIIFVNGNPKFFRNHKFVVVTDTLTTCGSFNFLVQYFGKGFHKKVHSPRREKWVFHENLYGFRSRFSIGCLISNLKHHVFSTKHNFYEILQTDLSNAFGPSDTEILIELARNLTLDPINFWKLFTSINRNSKFSRRSQS